MNCFAVWALPPFTADKKMPANSGRHSYMLLWAIILRSLPNESRG